MTHDGPLRVAVVGLGTISGVHLDAIRSAAAAGEVELVGVCDRDPARAQASASSQQVAAFDDHRELLAQARPDVVHLCTPHDEHVPVAIDALAAGVHVLTEKPIAATVAEGERLVAAAEQAARRGVITGVCFQNRYNPTIVALVESLSSGELGSVTGARASVWWHRPEAYFEAAPWRGRWANAGGGVLINQAIHTLDLLIHLLGEPTAHSGHARRAVPMSGVEVEDTVELRLTHPGPTQHVTSGLYTTNAHWQDAPVFLEIGTEQALLRLTDGVLWQLPRSGGDPVQLATDLTTTTGKSYWGASHAKLIADFYDHARRREPFWIDPALGQISLRILRETYAASGLIDPADL